MLTLTVMPFPAALSHELFPSLLTWYFFPIWTEVTDIPAPVPSFMPWSLLLQLTAAEPADGVTGVSSIRNRYQVIWWTGCNSNLPLILKEIVVVSWHRQTALAPPLPPHPSAVILACFLYIIQQNSHYAISTCFFFYVLCSLWNIS